MTKIYTKPEMGLEEKDPNKQLLTNGRSLDEETVKPVALACKQKALFIAVIVPPNTLSLQIYGLIFLVKVLKCTYKTQSVRSQKTRSISYFKHCLKITVKWSPSKSFMHRSRMQLEWTINSQPLFTLTTVENWWSTKQSPTFQKNKILLWKGESSPGLLGNNICKT